MFGNANVTKYMPGDTPPPDRHSMLKIVRARRETEWAIILNETNEFIGDCMIPSIAENYLGEIGCVLLQEHWGNGYAKEAMFAVIGHCANTLKLKRLCAKTDDQNLSAKRLIESLGFNKDAVFPEANFIGRVCDIAFYSKSIE
ncbi:MAG: GNAT family N-acetyltransferase [Oscillospiraceae bacterium]|nr:GNAT family N-acetyltransferase [Oscillospiraceae bacterium]